VVNKIEKKLDEIVDDNVLQFCSLDQQGRRPLDKKSLGEKEQEFLEALRSFYYDQQPNISNEEFDNLKEELLWAGSKVAILSSTEQRFMEASMSYAAGKPILSDSEYDNLKKQLRKKNSKVVQQGPRCSIRSRTMYSDCNPDYLKITLLNIPAVLLTLGALFSVDDLTGFEITKFLELPQPYGIIAVWGVALPALFVLSSSLTNLVLKDALILKGPCPNCNAEANTYFGDILTVPGSRETNTVDCANCKAKLSFNATKRQISVTQFPGEGSSKESKSGPSAKQRTASA
jgi:hypothetical protein